MRLRIARVVLLSGTLFVILDVISCRIFDDVMSPADANGLVRSRIDTPSGRFRLNLGAVILIGAGLLFAPPLLKRMK